MTNYELLDIVCDAVNPILFLLSIFLCAVFIYKKKYRKAGLLLGLLTAGMLFVYGVLFADNRLKIWHSISSDYSTHTAFAIAACISISAVKNWPRILVCIFCFYGAAILYQQYHSLLDVLSTSFVIGLPLLYLRAITLQKYILKP